jgi:CDP-diacylglycerol--serine O-phosphatidyltransferase
MRHIPNVLTLANLFCGCMALISLSRGNTEAALILIGVSMIFDFCDGLAARALNAFSAIGKDLDSLADMISFGLLPGWAVFTALERTLPACGLPLPLAWCGFLVTLFSALRLAKFNTDSRQSTHFIGLPTPANTAWILPLAVMPAAEFGALAFLLENAWFWLLFSLVCSGLLVAELPLFSLKFNRSGWYANRGQLVLAALSIPSILLFGVQGLPLIVLLYLILSIVFPPSREST